MMASPLPSRRGGSQFGLASAALRSASARQARPPPATSHAAPSTTMGRQAALQWPVDRSPLNRDSPASPPAQDDTLRGPHRRAAASVVASARHGLPAGLARTQAGKEAATAQRSCSNQDWTLAGRMLRFQAALVVLANECGQTDQAGLPPDAVVQQEYRPLPSF